MVELKNAIIRRGGRTAPYLRRENRQCAFSTQAGGNSIRLETSLDSKGGGTTVVQIEIGLDDLPAILGEIVNAWPERVGALLLEYAGAANKKVLERLNEECERRRRDRDQAVLMVEGLEPVDAYLRDAKWSIDDWDSKEFNELDDLCDRIFKIISYLK